ncbi:AMP-binding protein [Chryseolinea sp. T2]|uniref:AMP-binding protein n=1 Tax=Chryseolinea sp. T2 TaxID=3129255 RepID=UPI003076F77F
MSSILQKFLEWEKAIPDELFLRQPFNGKWKTYTYRQAGDEIRRIATGLKGLPPRSHVSILSKNCAHWIMADLAIMMCGHVSVPVYATLTASSIKQILAHGEVKAIFVGKLDNYSEQREGIPDGILKIGIGDYGISEEIQWEQWLNNTPLPVVYAWKPDEIFTIMYTSGTTGKFKGVMHSMGGFDVIATTGTREFGFRERPSLFSFLPLGHAAERMAIETIGIYLGATFSFPESLATFNDDLAATQPHHFVAVPRLWAKIREGVIQKIPQGKLDILLRIPLVGTIIKSKIKRKLGLSRATQIFSGAAPLSIELLRWFHRLDIEIFQGYGLTENCVSHLNRKGLNKIGTVGVTASCFETTIAAGGEIRVKGAGNMVGYYKEPELTKEAFDDERFLRTGDIGEIDKEGFLTITGRIKDQFKTDKGKYVYPAPIEMLFTGSSSVDQVCVVGMGIPQPIALIVLSQSGRVKSKQQLRDEFSALLQSINDGLDPHERLKKAVVMKSDWSIDNGLLTPTLKTKRNEIEKLKMPLYPGWYEMDDIVVWEG